MLVTTRGIVLHTFKYNDESLVAEVLTETEGVVSFMVHISHSPRAAVRYTLFRPLALLEFSWNVRPGGGIQRPKSVQVAMPLCSIPFDPYKTTMALFLAEFLRSAVKVETDAGPLFEYIFDSIVWLDTCREGYANFHLVFLLRLARFLGFEPNLENASPGAYFDLEASQFTFFLPTHRHYLPPVDAARLPLLMRMNFGTMHLFRFSGSERSRLLEYINIYYRLHLPDFPEMKSLAVLKELFDAGR
ncbi:MAG: DNA repair protein RecO C-terminal domain-containing protein [Bacteroidales bacterium]|nr:DNA repair protein RecO C-terminal domain-containing protein [Bacteroidales bacterium]